VLTVMKVKMEVFSKKNINSNSIKNIFLIILTLVVIGFIVFRPSTGIDEKEKEIELLKEHNKQLELSNDSLKVNNVKLKEEMGEIYGILEIRDTELLVVKNNIKVLEGKRNEVRNSINIMDGNDVSRTYTDYLKRRSKNDN
jgi:hypothetical protein